MSDNLKQIFEYELHRKLSLRARTTTSEMNLLLNAFKYYDVDENGTIRKENWSKAFNRIGLSGFSESDFNELFDMFDPYKTGIINYRSFTEYMYDLSSYEPYGQNSEFHYLNKNRNDYNFNNSHLPPYDPQVRTPTPFNQPNYDNNKNQITQNQNENIEKFKPITPLNSNNNNNIDNYNNLNNDVSNQQNQIPNKEMMPNQNLNQNKEGMKKYFDSLLHLFQDRININNGMGYYKLLYKLKDKQDKINKTISYEDLLMSIKEAGIDINDMDVKDFFILLDLNQENKILTEELLRLLRGFLNERRKMVIIEKFARFDLDRRGSTQISLIKSVYNANYHPEVLMGRKKENEVYEDFAFTLDTYISYKGIVDQITFEDFIEYYSAISASIVDDNYFIDMMNGVWNTPINYHTLIKNYNDYNMKNDMMMVQQGQGNYIQNISPVEQNKRPQSYNPSIRSTPKYNIISGQFDRYYDNNGQFINDVNYNYNLNTNQSQNQLQSQNQNQNKYVKTETKRNSDGSTTTITTTTITNSGYKNVNNNNNNSTFNQSNYQINNQLNNQINTQSNYEYNNQYNIQSNYEYNNNQYNNLSNYQLNNQIYQTNSSTDPIYRLRNMLISRGPKSLFVIEKMLSLYDTSHTGLIDYKTFEKIITIYRLSLTQDEILKIFKVFDKDNTGQINYDEFIRTLIGQISPRRDYLIKSIFNLVSNGRNELSINDLKKNYNSSRDPEWVARKKTREQVIADFVELLEIFLEYNSKMSKSTPGYMNFEDFYKFYSQISMGISDNNYFEYLVNNVWNLDGGSASNYYNYGNNGFQQRTKSAVVRQFMTSSPY